ncbi:hypothetical protein HNY73_003292 [Argiope bruennichi]|uniref:Uncharacterized protein n=1 Tax=Argiope bruennichi TaxID=94029 RepID=A0A8T0FWG2_ARGBR|nr:hypothetical protein HNY73_003292 [Argiope bruennichi]
MDNAKNSSHGVTSLFDTKHNYDSSDSLRYAILSELDDFIPDRTVHDKYFYTPGGFYIPRERDAKYNYHIEEVTNTEDNENKEELAKDSNFKILTGSSETETGITERPSFLFLLKNTFLNPLLLISAVVIPIAFIIEMISPNMFSGNVLPSVGTTIVSGFGRSSDAGNVSHVEQVLDAINELGVTSLEDPKCLKQFICQYAVSQSTTHSESSWSVQNIMINLENSINDEILNKFGLNQLFKSMEMGDCESLLCKGSPAYTQNVPLFVKVILLGRKIFNLTQVV